MDHQQWVERAEELAAKVRGYFTNPVTGKVEIPNSMNGDRDLYDLASRLTDRVAQPGTKWIKRLTSTSRHDTKL